MTEPSRVTSVEHVTDHSAVAQERLLLRAPIYRALVKTYIDRLQELEDVLYQVYTDTIDTAVGAQLRVIGKILGELPGSLSDEEFRTLLRGKILVLRSDGTGEDLISVTVAMLNAAATGEVHLRQYPRATVVVDPLVVTPYPETLLRMLLLAKSGGVKLQLIATQGGSFFDGDQFAFASRGIVNQTDANRGWSDEDGDVGGQLVGVLE